MQQLRRSLQRRGFRRRLTPVLPAKRQKLTFMGNAAKFFDYALRITPNLIIHAFAAGRDLFVDSSAVIDRRGKEHYTEYCISGANCSGMVRHRLSPTTNIGIHHVSLGTKCA